MSGFAQQKNEKLKFSLAETQIYLRDPVLIDPMEGAEIVNRMMVNHNRSQCFLISCVQKSNFKHKI